MKPWREWLDVFPSAAHSAPIGSCQHYAYRQILFPEQVSVAVLRMCTPLPPSTKVKQKLGVYLDLHGLLWCEITFLLVCVCVCVCVWLESRPRQRPMWPEVLTLFPIFSREVLYLGSEVLTLFPIFSREVLYLGYVTTASFRFHSNSLFQNQAGIWPWLEPTYWKTLLNDRQMNVQSLAMLAVWSPLSSPASGRGCHRILCLFERNTLHAAESN